MSRRFRLIFCGLLSLLAAASIPVSGSRAAEPIKIGFSMALTGGLAANGRAALIAFQMRADEINAAGGLLGGRKLELVYYDDQSNSSTVPGIYTKLLDIDKVDLVVSGYGTNLAAPAMPSSCREDCFSSGFSRMRSMTASNIRTTSRCFRRDLIRRSTLRRVSSTSR